MARVEFAPGIADDLERIAQHLHEYEVENIDARIKELIAAFAILESSPLIGRLADDGQRELIIGRRSRGYVALYRYFAEAEAVFVLALRSQREAGYK